jgi:hypothetical protein
MVFFNTEFRGQKIKVFGNYTDVEVDGVTLMDFDIVKVQKGRNNITEELGGDIDIIRMNILDSMTEAKIELQMNNTNNITEEE